MKRCKPLLIFFQTMRPTDIGEQSKKELPKSPRLVLTLLFNIFGRKREL